MDSRGLSAATVYFWGCSSLSRWYRHGYCLWYCHMYSMLPCAGGRLCFLGGGLSSQETRDMYCRCYVPTQVLPRVPPRWVPVLGPPADTGRRLVQNKMFLWDAVLAAAWAASKSSEAKA